MDVKIKICGLFRKEDIEAVNEAQPDFIGFVFAKSRRQVSADQAKTLKRELLPGIRAVGVFVDPSADEVIRLLEDGVIDLAQLHGYEDNHFVEFLKHETGRQIIKAVKVERTEDIQAAQAIPADYLLLDHGAGGTGKAFDWSLVQGCQKPFFLAGGIDLNNVEEAIRMVKPYAVDLSSGVETNGLKDRGKIIEIVRKVRQIQVES
jgi:phosphoribosylanthranilate isomerase